MEYSSIAVVDLNFRRTQKNIITRIAKRLENGGENSIGKDRRKS